MHFSAPPVLSSQGKHARTSSQTGLLQGPSKGTVEEESCHPLDMASRRRAENACVLPFGREVSCVSTLMSSHGHYSAFANWLHDFPSS